LGIIDKLITAPMWRLFESEGGILSINPYLKTAFEKFTDLRNLVNDFCGKTKLLHHKIEY
jgi:hypothetical protein